MRVFDFDGALYQGHCLWEFYIFCLWRHPSVLLLLPRQLWALFALWFGAAAPAYFWQSVFSFFAHLPDVNQLAKEFWTDRRLKRINRAYLGPSMEQAVVLSPLPECLLGPPCAALNIPCLGAVVDPHTGACFVPSFSAAEKLACFRAAFPEEEIGAFFSSRLGDEPLARTAKEAYLIRGGRALPWEEYLAKEGRLHAWLRHFLSPEFFRFWCVGWLNMAAAWVLEAGWSLVLSPNLAFTVGYLMSLFVSFILNSKITFRAPVSYLRFWRYLLSYIPNFVVQSLTVLIVHNWLGLPHLLAYFIAAIVGTPVTFCCLKFFAFQKQAG